MRKHLNIKIYGQVQGVGFRYKAKSLADRLRISGFVKNESGGTLYIEAEGQEQSLTEFIDWCKKGPFWAKVARVEIADGDLKDCQGFSIEV